MLKIPEVTASVTITDINTKIWEVWNKIPRVSDLSVIWCFSGGEISKYFSPGSGFTG